MIERIVVVSDLLRPDGNCLPGGRDRSTLWLCNAVAEGIRLACGLAAEAVTVANTPGLRAWIESQRELPFADAHWASLYRSIPQAEPLERLISARLRGCFCIGFETPPWLLKVMDAHRLPYLDVHVHPIRFLDDLIFAVRASGAETHARLLAMAVPESEVRVTASLLMAMGRFISAGQMPDDTLLVVGQRRYDSTQIVDGRFFDAMDVLEPIHGLCGRHPAVILKPHPFDSRHSLLDAASTAPTRVIGVAEDNIYRLMSLPQISAVLTVNSSVALEAPYFGKQVHTLAPMPLSAAWADNAMCGSHASVDAVVLTPDFWRAVLAPHVKVTPPDGMRLRAKPNRLRIAFDSFWNYQQVDTDRIPRPSHF